jgi:hypothetical protein
MAILLGIGAFVALIGTLALALAHYFPRFCAYLLGPVSAVGWLVAAALSYSEGLLEVATPCDAWGIGCGVVALATWAVLGVWLLASVVLVLKGAAGARRARGAEATYGSRWRAMPEYTTPPRAGRDPRTNRTRWIFFAVIGIEVALCAIGVIAFAP